MINRIVGNKLIPVSIRQDIIERSDGIPLFVEEITGAMLEAGSEEQESTPRRIRCQAWWCRRPYARH